MPGNEPTQSRDYARSHPALIDAHSGLANRLHFELVYNYLFEAGSRGLPFTVMLVSTGANSPVDQARAHGKAIEDTTRSSDLVSYVGPSRYVLLLLGTNLQGGRIAADRIEAALDGLDSVALSFGIAAYSEGMKSSETLLAAADTALLSAEEAGGGVEFG
jgi:GGDEF domain-containing protein